MTFRELLKLYREGKLDEDARREVEEAVDREDAILEYLSERDEIAIPDEEDASDAVLDRDTQAENRFRAELNRRIRRAFIRLGVCVGAVLLAVLLLVEFVLPRVVDRFYYDPGETVYEYSEENMTWRSERMSLDMSVYSELFLPGVIRDNVSVIRNGYGEYDIVIHQNISMTGRFTDVGGRISRGRLTLYDNNTLKRPVCNIFEWGINMPDPSRRLSEQIRGPVEEIDGSTSYYAAGMAGYPEEALERLSELEPRSVYRGYVSLDAVMDFESFQAFLAEHDLAEYDLWCAVQVAEEPAYEPNVGFDIYKRSTSFGYDAEKYPSLKYGFIQDEPFFLKTESEATEHLCSLLRYMGDQEKFWEMMKLNESYGSVDAMIEYLSENGIRIYGFSLATDKATLLELQNSPEVYSVAVEPIW